MNEHQEQVAVCEYLDLKGQKYTAMKNCTQCKEKKLMKLFKKNRFHSDGKQSYCYGCELINKKRYSRTKKNITTRIYNNQIRASKNRNDKLPMYTKQELKDWLFNQNLFHDLYKKYKDSDYKKELVPSIDRIDDSKGYSFDNIQLMTWEENNKKGNEDRKSGINNKVSHVVRQLSIETGVCLQEFYSVRQAERITGIDNSNISNCCRNKYGFKTAGGYKWEYA